jgi:hypothetical protein
MTARSADMIAARKLALAAGKQHRAGMQGQLKMREGIRMGVLPDLKRKLEGLCKKEKIARPDYEPLIRIIDLISPKQSDPSPSEIALEVRGIHRRLCRSERVHPMLLAFASIADESVCHAANAVRSVPSPSQSSGTVPFFRGSTVVSADLNGFIDGYKGARKYLSEETSIRMGIHWASCDSSLAEYQGLPWI